ncbi:DUF4394 domain-containing protein [Flavihumibacter sp. UBA7668]|uniref:DUF4394 domain-containing protein n=1 Tax=Flavihumibacter sp. UBA7668 TaxID=1946542 RepID=UPI0025C1167F|nr:DUF4394 domain-containing protein [Flavihumibacter sp. UBA7668]
MKRTTQHFLGGLALLGLISLASCKKDDSPQMDQKGPDIEFLVLDNGNKLVRFNAESPKMPISTTPIAGLQEGESVLAIDFRPATGQLYALSSTSRLLVIDEKNGNTRAIGTGPFSPVLSSSIAGFDFNPTVDRIRIVTSNGQNLRAHPETGAIVATDGVINGVTNAMVTGVAYSDSKAGTTTTTLFDIDTETDMLYKQDPPNNGTLVAVGKLNNDFNGEIGFDISPDNSAALAVATKNGKSTLYQVDLASGKSIKIGELMGVTNANGLAIPSEPVAYAISNGKNLLIFNPMAPMPITKAITGLLPDEKIMGIDFRPANGALYALGSSSRLYTLNTSNGAATGIGTLPFTTLLSGTYFGFDFNPTVDRIRVVSNTGQNLRLNPNDGTLAATDGMLNPGTPSVSAAAYTNNFAGATTTILYDIDCGTDKLYRQDPPNNGTLVEVGATGINIESSNGFDIGSQSGKAWAILTVNGTTKLYEINLNNGMVTAVGNYTFSGPMDGFSVGLGF